MNICFIIGKIISEIKFDFIIENNTINKDIVTTRFKILLENGSVIKVKSYGKIAEECFQKYVKSDIVSIYGILNSNGELEIQEIDLL